MTHVHSHDDWGYVAPNALSNTASHQCPVNLKTSIALNLAYQHTSGVEVHPHVDSSWSSAALRVLEKYSEAWEQLAQA